MKPYSSAKAPSPSDVGDRLIDVSRIKRLKKPPGDYWANRAWWRENIAWHHAQVSKRTRESANNLIKRIKRFAFVFRSLRNFRTRILLYAGNPTRTYCATSHPPKREEPVLAKSAGCV